MLDVVNAHRDPDTVARSRAAPVAAPVPESVTSQPRALDSATEERTSPQSKDRTGTVLDLSDSGDSEQRVPSPQEEEEEF